MQPRDRVRRPRMSLSIIARVENAEYIEPDMTADLLACYRRLILRTCRHMLGHRVRRQRMKVTRMLSILFLGAGLLHGSAQAFELSFPSPLRNNSHTYYAHLPGMLPGGESFFEGFIRSLAVWMDASGNIRLSAIDEEREACSDNSIGSTQNGVNTATFSDSFCGDDSYFAGPTVADALTQTSWNPFAILESDIIFNEGRKPLFETVEHYFHHVAVHEIGHTLGFGHSAVRSAIMVSRLSQGRRDPVLSIDDRCALAMRYGNPSDCPILLGEGLATNGRDTNARFVGGATTDRGWSFHQQFEPSDRITIYGTVVKDRSHARRPGNLHVVASTEDGVLFARHADGNFHPLADVESIPSAGELKIDLYAQDLVIIGTRHFGREPSVGPLIGTVYQLVGQTVYFYLAYSLDEEPGVYYYGSEPIRVSWSDD